MTKTLCLVVASGGSDKRRFYVVLADGVVVTTGHRYARVRRS